MKFDADGMTIPEFFGMISTLLLRQPVIDRTGLTGMFDFRLEFSRELEIGLGGARKGGGGGNILRELKPLVNRSPMPSRANSA
jgi:uncharacterized protein (TIGR03435 family)